MSNNKTGFESLWISFSIAAVWFSTHCGGGFATGNQEVNFYVKYGWTSLFLPIIAMVFVAWTFRNGLVLAKDYNVHDYKSFANALYHPYEKIFSFIFELCFMATILIAVSTSIAGAGALLQNVLGLPYLLGITCLGVILTCLTIFGAELIIRVLRYKAYFLIITLVILAYLGLQAGFPNAERFIATKETFGNDTAEAVLKMVLYVGFQVFGLIPCISVSHKITTTKECNAFGFFGVFLNGGFLAIISIMLLGFAPSVLKETLPVYYVTTQLGLPWLKIMYSLILFVALIGTAISFIFSTVARFEKLWVGKGVFESLLLRRSVIAIVTASICTATSVFGLTTLVVKGYGTIGYFAVIFVVIPLLTVGTVKIRKNAQLRKQQGIIEG